MPDTPEGEPPIEDDDAVEDRDGGADELPAEEEAGPPPATWAAREWLPREDAEAEEGPGFTEDFEEAKQELGESLEADESLEEESARASDEVAEADGEPAAPLEPEPAGDVAEGEASGGVIPAEPEVEEAEGSEEVPEAEAEPEAEEPAPVSSDTTEAETLAVGDREEAQEAALEGVRARAAEQATKRQTTVKPATPAGVARVGTSPVIPSLGDVGEAPPRRGLWLRFLAASLVIVSSMAAATAVSILVYFTDIARGLGGIEGVQSQLSQVEGGDPQTILILGSDKRPGDTSGRSDTTILLRVDPDKKAIALLSLPRDLKVNIPGLGVDKLNAAYAYGGPKLTLKVVKQLTGLTINHVVNINFLGFADAVNAIECVYVDVDRRYLVPPEAGYAEIDIEAGYQQLCGLKALQYVRFRHDDNDLVRGARQQDFLREARQKVPPSKLYTDRNELMQIFTDYTTSDITKAAQVIEVLKTFIEARSAELKEVHFQGDIGGPDSTYVTASQEEIKTAVQQFLGVQDTPGVPGGADQPPSGAQDRQGGSRDTPRRQPDKPEQPVGPPMVDSSGAGLEYANKLVNLPNTKRRLEFPVMYPTRIVPGSSLNAASRSFPIDGPGNDKYHGYKIVVLFESGAFSQFYGVSGTDWEDPPILENPSEEDREIDGRRYDLYYDGDRLRMVAWHTDKGSYWVINTLLQTLSEEQMLALARSVRAP